MEDFNIHGWSAIHEAAYKGYANAVTRFINYAKETDKMYLLELKTIDELKATPLLIAALGGHLDCIQVLIDSGANLNEFIFYKGKSKHSIVDIAVIRQDINVLLYLYENFNEKLEICTRLCNLMINETNDDEMRASIGRTLEVITEKTSKDLMLEFKNELINNPKFATLFTTFFKQSFQFDESFSSCSLILLNILYIDDLRKEFNLNKCIDSLIKCLDIQNDFIQKEYQLKLNGTDSESIIEIASFEKIDSSILIVASIGQALAEISKYDDCIDIIIKENYCEKIILFIKLLFDLNNFRKKYYKSMGYSVAESLKFNKTLILFEQYIHTYLICLGNLIAINTRCKMLFNEVFLYEYIVNLWFQMHMHSQQPSQQPPYMSQHHISKPNQMSNRRESQMSSYSIMSSNYYSNSLLMPINTNSKITSSLMQPKAKLSLTSSLASLDIGYRNKAKLAPLLAFDHIPEQFNAINSIIDQEEPKITSNLIRLLKLAIIDCIGKSFYNNIELKSAYLYPDTVANKRKQYKYLHKDKNWHYVTNLFINALVEFLDANRAVDRELRASILKFISLLFANDRTAVRLLVDFQHSSGQTKNETMLIDSLKGLIRKSSALVVREEAIKTIWIISGADDSYNTLNEKLFIYKAIGTQRFVDCLCDSDYLSLISLEALQVIAGGPPFRESVTGKLIKGTEEVARLHAIPSIIRLLKTKNEELLINTLKTVSKCCVSIGYDNNYRNQITFCQLGTLQILNEICQRRLNASKMLKHEAYICLSSLALNNISVKNMIYDNFYHKNVGLIEILLLMLLGIDENSITNDEVTVILDKHAAENKLDMTSLEYRIMAGLALSAFAYRDDELKLKLIEKFDKIPWKIFIDLYNYIVCEEFRFKMMNNTENLFKIVRLKCLFAFLMASLYSIIDSIGARDINTDNVEIEEIKSESIDQSIPIIDVYDDPRAVAIKVLIDMVRFNNNSYIRTIAIDSICRLINGDRTLVEPIVSIDIIEILCEKLEFIDSSNRTENEIGNCSLTLAYLTEFSPEARRRIIKIARRVSNVMKMMTYYNKRINSELAAQWKHYENLMDIVKKKQPLNEINAKKSLHFLPLITKTPRIKTKLPKLKI